MAIPTKPGIYPDLPFEDYCRIDACNHSKLKYLSLTPAHARYLELNPPESTKQQDLGHAIHTALLEPERFNEQYVVAPDVGDRRYKEAKDAWASFVKQAAGKTVISAEDNRCIEGLKDSIRAHETASAVMYGRGINEVSLVWEDPETGLLCKARVDRLTELNGWPFAIDLKSDGERATTDKWQMAVMRYGLHQQAAHYLRGLSILAPLPDGYARKFAWVVCETEPPYLVRVFEADDAALSIGNDEVAKHLRIYSECRKAGTWPGWPQGLDYAGLPAWAMKKYDLD